MRADSEKFLAEKNDQRFELLVAEVFVGIFHSVACSN